MLPVKVWRENDKSCATLDSLCIECAILRNGQRCGDDVHLLKVWSIVYRKAICRAEVEHILQLYSSALRNISLDKGVVQRVWLANRELFVHKYLTHKVVYKWGVNAVTAEVLYSRYAVAE